MQKLKNILQPTSSLVARLAVCVTGGRFLWVLHSPPPNPPRTAKKHFNSFFMPAIATYRTCIYIYINSWKKTTHIPFNVVSALKYVQLGFLRRQSCKNHCVFK